MKTKAKKEEFGAENEKPEKNASAGSRKDDVGKSRVDLIPPMAIIGAGRVFGYGVEKYGARAWEAGIPLTRLYGACLRHLLAWRDGFDVCEESGLLHLDHAIVNLCMIRGLGCKGDEWDDREEEIDL